MINEFDMVKPEKFGHLHLVYHFTVPLSNIGLDKSQLSSMLNSKNSIQSSVTT